MTTERALDIVVGVDHSAVSIAALRWAAAEAAASGRRVVALRAWTFEPVYDLGAAIAATPQAAAEIQQRELDNAITRVMLDHPEVEIQPQLVEQSPAVALAEASKTAAMVVLGSHGRGRLLTMLVGSVTEHCLREASCPVVVIPARTVPEPEKVPVAAEPEGTYYPGPLL
jgi:nucleotide-binding universal stress UspA family protein